MSDGLAFAVELGSGFLFKRGEHMKYDSNSTYHQVLRLFNGRSPHESARAIARLIDRKNSAAQRIRGQAAFSKVFAHMMSVAPVAAIAAENNALKLEIGRLQDRKRGVTTTALANAPQGAVYVWRDANLDYPHALAQSIGRNDLKIVGPWWLRPWSVEGTTLKRSQVVVDHSLQLTETMREALQILDSRAVNSWREQRYFRVEIQGSADDAKVKTASLECEDVPSVDNAKKWDIKGAIMEALVYLMLGTLLCLYLSYLGSAP